MNRSTYWLVAALALSAAVNFCLGLQFVRMSDEAEELRTLYELRQKHHEDRVAFLFAEWKRDVEIIRRQREREQAKQ